MNADGIRVEIVDGQITVTRPATNDTIAYENQRTPRILNWRIAGSL
jgi:hypothetical protein